MNFFSRTFLRCGNTTGDNRAVASCPLLRRRFLRVRTTGGLILGQGRSKRSSTMPTTVVWNRPQYKSVQKQPAAERVETLPFGFVGMCFNVAALPVARAVRALR